MESGKVGVQVALSTTETHSSTTSRSHPHPPHNTTQNTPKPSLPPSLLCSLVCVSTFELRFLSHVYTPDLPTQKLSVILLISPFVCASIQVLRTHYVLTHHIFVLPCMRLLYTPHIGWCPSAAGSKVAQHTLPVLIQNLTHGPFSITIRTYLRL